MKMQPTTAADRLLTTAEVSEMINVPVATLRWWRHERLGPKSFTLGQRRVAYKECDVRRWLDQQYASDPKTA